MRLPKYHLLYFKCLLDVAFIQFFDKYNDQFAKYDGKYFFCGAMSKQAIEEFFMKSVQQQLSAIIKPFDVIKAPDYYFIIGACQPKDNFLLNFKDETFPKKLAEAIDGKLHLKYFLREQDIVIDMVQFNEICCNVFNKMFFGCGISSQKHVIFLTHKNLDCYSLFKILKCIFGKANCINMRDQFFGDIRAPIIAVNDLIDKSIHNKTQVNKDKRFKMLFNEVKQFIDMKLER